MKTCYKTKAYIVKRSCAHPLDFTHLTSGKQSLAKTWSRAVFPHWLSPTTTILHLRLWLGSIPDWRDSFCIDLLSFIDCLYAQVRGGAQRRRHAQTYSFLQSLWKGCGFPLPVSWSFSLSLPLLQGYTSTAWIPALSLLGYVLRFIWAR